MIKTDLKLDGEIAVEIGSLNKLLHKILLYLINDVYFKHFGTKKEQKFWENRLACLTDVSLKDPTLRYVQEYVKGIANNLLIRHGINITAQTGNLSECFIQYFPATGLGARNEVVFQDHIYRTCCEQGQEALLISGDSAALCNSIAFQDGNRLYSDAEIELAKRIGFVRNQCSHDDYSSANSADTCKALGRLIEYINMDTGTPPYCEFGNQLVSIKQKLLFFNEVGEDADAGNTGYFLEHQIKLHAPYLCDALDLIAVISMQEEQYETVVKMGQATHPTHCYVTVATLLGILQSQREKQYKSDCPQTLDNLIAVLEEIAEENLDNVQPCLLKLKQYDEFVYTIFAVHMLFFCDLSGHPCICFRNHAVRYIWLMGSRYFAYIDSIRAQNIYALLKSFYFVHKDGTQARAAISYSSESRIGRGMNTTISRYLNAICFLRYLPNPLLELRALLDCGNYHHAYLCLTAEKDQRGKPLVYFYNNPNIAGRRTSVLTTLREWNFTKD